MHTRTPFSTWWPGPGAQANKELTVHRLKWQHLAEFEACKELWVTSSCQGLNPEEVQTKVRRRRGGGGGAFGTQ